MVTLLVRAIFPNVFPLHLIVYKLVSICLSSGGLHVCLFVIACFGITRCFGIFNMDNQNASSKFLQNSIRVYMDICGLFVIFSWFHLISNLLENTKIALKKKLELDD